MLLNIQGHFYFYDITLMASFFLNLDTNLLISARQFVWPEYSRIIQILGESIVIWGIFFLITLWIVWTIQKNETHKRNALRIFFLIILIFIIYSILNLGIPQWRESPQIVAWGIRPLIPHPIDNSFPSWHALFGGTLCMGIWLFMKNKTLFILTLLITLITGISRVIWGVHYPWDILWGFIIASIGSYFLFPLVISNICEKQIYPFFIRIARIFKL